MQWLWQKVAKLPPIHWRELYTCDSSPDEGAAAGENVDAARPGCFAASTAPRGDGRVSGAGPSRVGRLAVNVMLLVKINKIKWFLLIRFHAHSDAYR